MLCQRWRQALRNRHSGAGFKPPLGAVVQSHGAERRGKRAGRTGQVSALKLNESEQLMKRRYTLQMQVGTEDFVGSSGKVWRKPDY